MKLNEKLFCSSASRPHSGYLHFRRYRAVPWFDGDVSANSLEKQIKDLDVDEIRVHIDSYGGAVSEGWAIYNALRQHPAKVITYGDGFVASAALYPFLAGDERIASNLSAYYLHQVMVSAEGYADELRAAANEAEMMTEIGINAFVERTKMAADDVRALMEAETWLSPARRWNKVSPLLLWRIRLCR